MKYNLNDPDSNIALYLIKMIQFLKMSVLGTFETVKNMKSKYY